MPASRTRRLRQRAGAPARCFENHWSIGSQSPTRLRLLFLLPFVPRLDARHGGRTTAGIVTRLAERHDAALICLRAPDERGVAPELAGRCELVEEIAAPSSHELRRGARLLWSLARGIPIGVSDSSSREFGRRVRSTVSAFVPDVVHVELERMAPYAGALADHPAVRVLVAQEAAGETARDLLGVARGPQRLVRHMDLRAWGRFEPAALGMADAVVCYTDRDRRALASAAPTAEIETIPLRVELPPRALDPLGSGRPAVLFVGGFGHGPNVDAAVRLAARIFPTVRARCPEAVLQIVGDKPPRRLRALASEDVVVTGRVEDVTPYLDHAAVVAAPLRLGGGMRVKVLEALAAGKAVVASPLAAEGVAVTPGRELLLGESDEQLADAVARLLLDPTERATLAASARAWAQRELDPEHAVARYDALYRRLLTRARS